MMRRSEREITDIAEMESILQDCSCCRVGFYDDGEIYIVPLSFGWKKAEDRYTLYFHCAKEGRKLDLLRRHPRVGFEMDRDDGIYGGEEACSYSVFYRSIIGSGRATVVEEAGEKLEGLSLIMEHYTGRADWEFSAHAAAAAVVFKIEIENMSCKAHRRR